MKCKECKFARKVTLQGYRCKTGKPVDEMDYYVCPLDEDDVFPADFDCINEEEYQRLLGQIRNNL